MTDERMPYSRRDTISEAPLSELLVFLMDYPNVGDLGITRRLRDELAWRVHLEGARVLRALESSGVTFTQEQKRKLMQATRGSGSTDQELIKIMTKLGLA